MLRNHILKGQEQYLVMILETPFVLDEEEPRSKKGWIDDILEKRDAENSESEGGDSSEDSKGSESGSD